MPFTYALSPVFLSLGPVSIRWYSLVYVAGFLVAYWLLRTSAREKRIKNLTPERAEDYLVWLIVGSIAGARLFYALVYNPGYFIPQPWKILYVWEGGMSIHGGLLGAAAATYWYCKRERISFYKLADLLVVPLSLFLALGRIANFVNAELVGGVTNVPWCVNYPPALGIPGCRHPSQFYESGKNLLIFCALLPLYLKGTAKKRLRDGTLFWLFILLYGIGRFVTNYWRAPDPGDPLVLGLLVGQWLSLIMVAWSGIVLGQRAAIQTL
jgi:phosphatidylglycerol---prolipoprotein diacylglyceryl transferase